MGMILSKWISMNDLLSHNITVTLQRIHTAKKIFIEIETAIPSLHLLNSVENRGISIGISINNFLTPLLINNAN